MAAAEYYNGGGGLPTPGPTPHPAPSHQYPPQQNPHPQQSSQLPYPLSDAPPPYSAYAEPSRPQSQPHPQAQQQAAQPGGPYAAPTSQPHYPPEKNEYGPPPPGQNMYGLQGSNAHLQPPQQAPQQQPYPYQGGSAMQQVYGGASGSSSNNYNQRPSSTPAYGRPQGQYYEQGPARSRSRSRSRRRRHRHDRPQTGAKKSSGVNTFLGAGGGAIIGDAIFPGLGTLGGALLGGFGGHEYGKRRSQSNPHRTRERSYSNDDYYESDHRRGRRN